MAIKKQKYVDSASMVEEVNANVTANDATETVVPKVPVENKSKKVKVSLAELLTPQKEELKSAMLTIRVKPSVLAKFDSFCEQSGTTRAAMFEFWVNNIVK